MFKLICGELYRVLHKKSLYVYLGILAFGYVLLGIVRSGGFNDNSIVGDASDLFYLTPALVGGFLFSANYTDDLNAKNLITLVGYGMGKSKIVIAKIILATFFVTAFFGLLPLFHSTIYMGFGYKVTTAQLAAVYVVSVKYLLTTLAYIGISSIMVYGMQRPTFSIVSYILLAFGVIGNLLAMGVHTLNLNISDHLISGITNQIMAGMLGDGVPLLPIIEYASYIIISSVLAIIIFNKKEMEF